MKILARGKHSIIFLKDSSTIVKRFLPNLRYNFLKEILFLKILEPYNFVPKIYKIDYSNLEIYREYIQGIYIKDIRDIEIHKNILYICYFLDTLGIDKKEMNRPEKHILISNKGMVYFIDWERSTFSKKPKNVTQFLIYLKNKFNININQKLIKNYKKTYSYFYFKKILEGI